MTITPTTHTNSAVTGVRSPYTPVPGVYDEMMAPTGTIRAGWERVFQWFSEAGPDQQADYARKLAALIFDNFSDPLRGSDLWGLDLAPLVIDPATWSTIETAACQRARLYEAILADLYGEQHVFKAGLVPQQMILSDKGFLRPLYKVHGDSGRLTFLALDFARDAQGSWRIIDAHTETPAGHGFALANRMVITEVVGNLFRQSGSRRIAPFYQSLTDDLLRRSGNPDPTLAVLAPASNTSAFVGHSFMARYMGFKNVQGSDLRIVGNAVYLKTIDGLKKIDLLIRAIEGDRADPLELTPDAFDGAVGLVQACRQNPNLLVNALGTAIVENRGLSPLLPALSNHFLSEDLLINDSDRLWLGDANSRATVLAGLDDYVIHDAREGTGSPGQAAQGRNVLSLDASGEHDLRAEINCNGHRLVAEKPVAFATAPTRTDDGLRPESYALRVFVSRINGAFAVMPGGLALSVDSGTTVALRSSRSQSRDVWVVGNDSSSSSVNIKRLMDRHEHVQPHAQQLQSRAADNLFWLGRYTERADGTLRLVRQTLKRSAADLAAFTSAQMSFRPLQDLLHTAKLDRPTPHIPPLPSLDTLVGCLQALCASSEHPLALNQTLLNIQRLAVDTRDRLSEDAWHTLNAMGPASLDGLSPMAERIQAGHAGGASELPRNTQDIIQNIDVLLLRFAAFSGLSHENMTRNPGWSFLDLGRRVERAKWISELLLSLFGRQHDDTQLSDDLLFALKVADSYITFRSRFRFAATPEMVLDLLIVDKTNPRSLAYQLDQISCQIDMLPKSSDDAARSPDQRLALKLMSSVSLAQSDELAELNNEKRRPALVKLLTDVTHGLPQVCELLSRNYFSLVDETPRNLRTPL